MVIVMSPGVYSVAINTQVPRPALAEPSRALASVFGLQDDGIGELGRI